MMTDLLDSVADFANLHVMVIGDIMLDHYISGSTERTSPEAPVPVVLVEAESFVAGGAANVAHNLTATGANASLCGLCGQDERGDTLISTLNAAAVNTSNISRLPGYSTIVKSRVVSQGQQIVRFDYERPWIPTTAALESVSKTICEGLGNVDAVLLSDYGKGFLAPEILDRLFIECQKRNLRIFVDPKGRNYSKYRGAYAITPNSREAHEATGIATETEEGLKEAAESIQAMTGCSLVIITRGADGLALFTGGNITFIPASAREVYDVTGAGDTFVAWLTMGMAAGLQPARAAYLANAAAGIAVGRSGPAVVSPFDIRQALAPGKLGKKILPESSLGLLGEQLRSQGKTIVLTNGCFDFLHAGHLAFLQEAKARGDVLVLATNSDASISRLKGAPRPVIAQRQREELLAAIEAVDYVTVFADDTPHNIIAALKPDLLVKGGNYNRDQVEGADLAEQLGGRVVTIPIVLDFHTRDLLRNLE